MEQGVKVTFYLKKNETNASGHCPVMGRLTIGESEAVFSAKLTAHAASWSNGRVKGKSADAARINRRLDEYRASALTIRQAQSALRERVTAEEVKSLLLGMACHQETLLSYFGSFIENIEKRVGVNRAEGTTRSYRYARKCISQFLLEKHCLSDIPFSALDRSFIDKYDLYLRTERCLAPGTIVRLTTNLNTIIRNAVADGILTCYPFAGYEPVRPKRRQRYLSREELNRLMTTPLDSPKQYLIRDMFLFACYTGISHGDLCRLTASDLETTETGEVWIKTSRKKTGVGYELPLLDLPLHILDKYRGLAPDGRLLPMYDNRETNCCLKKIAKIAVSNGV